MAVKPGSISGAVHRSAKRRRKEPLSSFGALSVSRFDALSVSCVGLPTGAFDRLGFLVMWSSRG